MSGFERTNDGQQLIEYSGAWIVLPTYMCYVFIAEVFEALVVASGAGSSSSLLAIKDE